MTNEFEFPVELKETAGKGAARKVRAAGMVPGILYGHDTEPVMVIFEERLLVKALSTPAGRNVFLKFKSEAKELDGAKILIKDLQVHPLKRRFVHADFYKLDLNRAITAEVPVRLEGTSEGQKLGGILQIARHALEVSCLPDALPESIVVNISKLGFGDSIHISDIEEPEGVTFLQPGKLAVCAIVAPAATSDEAAEGEEEELEEEGSTETAESEEE
ncbi:MAG: 50S ribosomal protein L25 [Deltaproteobacteria bacterium]|nr:MAG: 50S ribosomal protein L25 [Deltaproteobacteria bacterium]